MNSKKALQLFSFNRFTKNRKLVSLTNLSLFHTNNIYNNHSSVNKSINISSSLYYKPIYFISQSSLKTQNTNTLFITKDLYHAILPQPKLDYLFLIPSIFVFIYNSFTAWTYLSSSLFAVTSIVSLIARQAFNFLQSVQVLAWQVQLSLQGKLIRYYITLKKNGFTNNIAQFQGGSSAEVRNQLKWFFKNIAGDFQQNKCNQKEQIINPLTKKKAYPNPRQQSQLFNLTYLQNLQFIKKLKEKTVRFAIQPEQIISYKFKSKKMKDIQKPNKEQDIKKFMENVQNELLQIQASVGVTKQQKRNIKFLININEAQDSNYKQKIISLGLGQDIKFK